MSIRLPGSSQEIALNTDNLTQLEHKLEELNAAKPFFHYRLVLEGVGEKKVLTCRQLTWNEIFHHGKTETSTAKLADITTFLNDSKLVDTLKTPVEMYLSRRIEKISKDTHTKVHESAELVKRFDPAILDDGKLKTLMYKACEEGNKEDALVFFRHLSEEGMLEELEKTNTYQIDFLDAVPDLVSNDAIPKRVDLALRSMKDWKFIQAHKLIQSVPEINVPDTGVTLVLQGAIKNKEKIMPKRIASEFIQKMNPAMLSVDSWLSLLKSAVEENDQLLAEQISKKMLPQAEGHHLFRHLLLSAIQKEWKEVALSLLEKLPKEAFENDTGMLKALEPLFRLINNEEQEAVVARKLPEAALGGLLDHLSKIARPAPKKAQENDLGF